MGISRFAVVFGASLLALVAIGQERVKIGRVGFANKDTSIYEAPDPKSTIHYELKMGEYLVITSESKGGFWPVLLKNKHVGYVPESDVTVMPYDVTRPKPLTRAQINKLGKMTSSGLSRRYADNPIEAGDSLNGGLIRLSGKIASISEMDEGCLVLLFGHTESSFVGVLFTDYERSFVSKLKKGGRLSAVVKITGSIPSGTMVVFRQAL